MKKLFFIGFCLALLVVTTIEPSQVKADTKEFHSIVSASGNTLHPALFPQAQQHEASMFDEFKQFTDPKCQCEGCSTDANGVRYCC